MSCPLPKNDLETMQRHSCFYSASGTMYCAQTKLNAPMDYILQEQNTLYPSSCKMNNTTSQKQQYNIVETFQQDKIGLAKQAKTKLENQYKLGVQQERKIQLEKQRQMDKKITETFQQERKKAISSAFLP